MKDNMVSCLFENVYNNGFPVENHERCVESESLALVEGAFSISLCSFLFHCVVNNFSVISSERVASKKKSVSGMKIFKK